MRSLHIPSSCCGISLPACFTFLIVAGCTTFDYQEYGAENPENYFGTQPGYHMLSEYYSVDVSDRIMTFYFLGNTKNEKRRLGAVATFWFDHSNYGPREIAFAVASDGKRILFFDEPGVAEGKPVQSALSNVVANLYAFDAESEQKTLLFPDVHRRGISCVDLPANYVRFGRFISTTNIAPFAFSTDSVEVSLEDRRKRLFESGEKDAICGPL